MAKKPRDPFELKLSDDQYQSLALFLCDELQRGLDAKATQDVEVDYWHQLYEQARTRQGRNAPWPDAADLTSYLPSEKVDALHARLVRTVLGVDPIWSVEGWGEAADRAPFVEEFHQWKAEEGRLQQAIDKLALISLIEPRGLLEVYEGTETRVTRKRVMAKIMTDPMTGGMVYDEDMEPRAVMGPDGKYVPPGPQEPGMELVVDETEKVRTGPVERIIPYRDSVILPGHARDREDIWGYGKRLWRRFADIQRMAEAGVYDKSAVEKMSWVQDKLPDQALTRANMSVAPTDSPALAEKELWEVLVLLDLNAFLKSRNEKPVRGAEYHGSRWYLATLHLDTQQMIRFQHDDMERSRFVPVVLFPRTDRVTEGFSFVGHKLITTTEEHTAWRNMAADRAAMVVQAPVKRQVGALWDPYDQPWGPKAVIDVRDMNEIEPVQVPDLSAPVFNHIQMMERTAERIAGVNDIASGQIAQESRTLGEVQMATANSEVRMDLVVRRFQEAMEEIAQIRHAILKRTVAEMPDGVEPPRTLVNHLEGRGVDINAFMPDRKITAAMLEGAFRFKPRGSVETADPQRQRMDFVQMLQTLPALLQAFPMLAMMFQTPQAARAMGREFLRLFKVENQQAFLGSPAQDFAQGQMLTQNVMMPGIPPMGMMPPQPMGGPPAGGPGLPPPGPPMGPGVPPLAPGPALPQ